MVITTIGDDERDAAGGQQLEGGDVDSPDRDETKTGIVTALFWVGIKASRMPAPERR